MNTRHEILHPLIVLGLFAFAPTFASAATYYIAPSGSDYNPGTQSAPFATLQKAHDIANPRDTIWMRGGTYFFSKQTTLTRDGTSGNRIQLFAFPGEKPIIDALNQRSGSDIIQMNSASWWHIKGIELKNGARQGIHAQGSSGNNIFEQLNIHHIGRLASAGGTGTALAIYGTGGNNLILNNDVHDNEDQLSFGGGANGINFVTSGTGNIIRGNRAWCNSDDGFDMWNSAPVLIENNWVFESGRGINCRATGGNGHGLKLGGKGSGDGGHTVRNNVSWNNKVDGFHENGGDLPMKMYNNTAWNNGRNSFWFSNPATTFRNNISHDTVGPVAGSQPFNSWTLPVTLNNADFASLSYACARNPRQADGSLPVCSFLRLATGSDLINKGTNVGIPFSGSASDLGAFEFGGPAPPATTPPASHWTFNQSSGLALDKNSANNNHLTLIGGASFAPGRIGNALSLNGSTAYATDKNTTGLNVTSTLTIAAWLKPASLPAGQIANVLYKGNTDLARGYGLNIGDTSGNKLNLRKVGNSNVLSNVTVPVDGKFHHFAVTWSAATGQGQFYVDGVLAQTVSAPGAIATPIDGDVLEVGRNPVWGSYFRGLVDELQIYNRVLPAAEISALAAP